MKADRTTFVVLSDVVKMKFVFSKVLSYKEIYGTWQHLQEGMI